jgi:hypothetical protein
MFNVHHTKSLRKRINGKNGGFAPKIEGKKGDYL